MDILFVDYDVDDIVIMGEKSVLRGLDMIFMLFVMFLWEMLEYVVVNKKRVIFMNILF